MKTLRRIVADQKTRVAIAMAAGLVLLAIWLSFVDIGEIGARLSTIEVKWIALFALLWGAAAFTRSLRWRAILSRVVKVPPMESFALFMSCMFVNFLIPLRMGEAVAGLALKRNRKVPFARSLPTQLMDRLFDLTPIVPALALSFVLMRKEGYGSLMAILVFVTVVFAGLGGIVLLSMSRPEKAKGLIRMLVWPFPRRVGQKLLSFGELCLDGLVSLKMSFGAIMGLVALTFLALAFDAASLHVIFLGLGVTVSPSVILIGYTFLFLTSALPRPPGLVGSHEVLFLLIFSLLLGVDKNLASAAVVAGHLMLAFLLTVTGALSLFFLGIRSVSVVREHLPTATTTEAS